jgi:hypothetical protein
MARKNPNAEHPVTIYGRAGSFAGAYALQNDSLTTRRSQPLVAAGRRVECHTCGDDVQFCPDFKPFL